MPCFPFFYYLSTMSSRIYVYSNMQTTVEAPTIERIQFYVTRTRQIYIPLFASINMLAAKKKKVFLQIKKKWSENIIWGLEYFINIYGSHPSLINTKKKKKTEKANGLRRIFEMKKVHTKGKFQKSNYRKIQNVIVGICFIKIFLIFLKIFFFYLIMGLPVGRLIFSISLLYLL